MKLATLKDGSRDGRLVVVSRDLSRAVAVPRIAATLSRSRIQAASEMPANSAASTSPCFSAVVSRT